MDLPVYSVNGEKTGNLEGSDKVFNLSPKPEVVEQAVTWYLASKRRGTHSSLTRGEVRGGGRKPWRQKGTGRARVGSIRSPLWKKGGVIFGPKPRDYSYALPLKIRRLAMRMALSDKAREQKLIVVEDWKIASPKTKEALKILKGLNVSLEEKSLIVLDESNQDFFRAGRNIAGVKVIFESDLNIHDLLKADNLLVGRTVLKRLEEKLA